jgi:hypothetical protein
MKRRFGRRFQAKSGQDWPLDRGIVPSRGLIILCAAGKRGDSAKVAREKATAGSGGLASGLKFALLSRVGWRDSE